MNKLGTTLTRIMEKRHLNQKSLAHLSGVDPATISRVKNGEQAAFGQRDFEKILAFVSNDSTERAELLRSYLLDQCTGPGSELITIDIRDAARTALAESPVHYGVELPQRLETALRILRRACENNDKDLQELITYLADLYSQAKQTAGDQKIPDKKIPPQRPQKS